MLVHRCTDELTADLRYWAKLSTDKRDFLNVFEFREGSPLFARLKVNWPFVAIAATMLLQNSVVSAQNVLLDGPSVGLRVVTAVSEGDRDFYSFKTVKEVTGASYVVGYENDVAEEPYPGARVYSKNLRSGKSFFPTFSRNIPHVRDNSTALAIPISVLKTLKDGGSAEIAYGTGDYYSRGIIKFIKTDETQIIWNDQMISVPTIIAKYESDAYDMGTSQFLGKIEVSMEVLDSSSFPIRLHAEGKVSGRPDRGHTVQTVSVETGEDLKERALSVLDDGVPFATYNLRFDFNSAEILPRMKPALEAFAEILRERPSLRIRIVGHTDSIGKDQPNLDLSISRANSVVAELVQRYGIQPSRLSAEGRGETEPKATNKTLLGRSFNRRVEFAPNN